MTRFLNLARRRARHRAACPIMIDSSKWSVIEAGLKCLQGKGDRQLDQPQGGRGEVPRAGARSSAATARPWSSWRSTSRARPTTVERKVAICRARLPHPDRGGRLPARGHHLRPERPHRRRPASRSTTTTRSTSSRRRGGSRQTLPLREGLRRRLATSRSRSAATTPCARRCTRRSSTTRSAPASTWGSSTPASSRSTRRSRRTCSSCVEDVLLNRRPDATERLVEFAERLKAGRGNGRGEGRRVAAAAPSRSGSSHALVKGIADYIEADTSRRRARSIARAARRHRGPAHGRHERRRRPLRRREDVPAAGRQERPRHEEGRRVPDAVHGGARSAAGTLKRRGDEILIATVKGDVHDIGKNIVGVVLALQQLRGDRPRRHGRRARRSSKAAQRDGRRHHRPLRPDHAVARRDGPRRAARWSAQGFTVPLLIGGATTSPAHTAVKIAPAYGQPVVHVLDASRAVGVVEQPPRRRAAPGVRARRTAQQAGARVEDHASARRSPLVPARGTARARRPRTRLGGGRPPRPVVHRRPRRSTTSRSRSSCPYIDWSPFFHAWELRGRYPQILDDATVGEKARELFADAQALLARDRRRSGSSRPRGVYGFFPANADRRRHRALHRRRRATQLLATLHTLRQQMEKREGQPSYEALADFVAPRESGPARLPRRASPSRPGIGVRRALPRASRRTHDDYRSIMAKALADRLAEAFAELLHQRARAEWGYGRDESLSHDDLITREVPRHPPRARATRPAPTTPRSGRSSRCSTPRRTPASRSPRASR